MPSRFLPPDFDPARPVAIIAGRARYPLLMAAAMRARGLPLRLIAFEGETLPDLVESFPPEHRALLRVGQVGKALQALARFRAGYAVMAGQITPRRLFHGLHPDFKALQILASLKERNAETIFSALAAEIEALGVRMLDARAFFDHDLATIGDMTGGPSLADPADLAHGVQIAREIARLDIGQGCVVCRGTVLAVEAFEGTDPMLRRAGSFRASPAIFVKTVKPGQDYRFDVPVFGLRTLEVMRASGIAVAALEAGQVIMLEKEQILAQARLARLQLLGFSPPSPPGPQRQNLPT